MEAKLAGRLAAVALATVAFARVTFSRSQAAVSSMLPFRSAGFVRICEFSLMLLGRLAPWVVYPDTEG